MVRPRALRSRCLVLGTGQLVAAGITASATLLPELRDAHLAAHLVGAALWALLGVVTLSLAGRHERDFDASILASVLVLGYQTLIADRGQLQLFNVLGLLLLGVLAATYCSRAVVAAFLALACVTFGLAAAVHPLLVSWVLTVLAMLVVVANTVLVRVLHEQNRMAALTDPLTGALNRSGLEEQAAAVRSIADRSGLPTSVAFIDLDGFKAVNDESGHAAGDRLLADLVAAWRRELRPSDLVARVGGDEFVIVLAGTGPEAAARTLHRLHGSSPAPWTAGLAVWSGESQVGDAIDRADQLMYEAKQHPGRKLGARDGVPAAPSCACTVCTVDVELCPWRLPPGGRRSASQPST